MAAQDPADRTAANGAPLFAPPGMVWIPDPHDEGRYGLADVEAVLDPDNYVNPRKGDPDYPDPDFTNAVLAPTFEALVAEAKSKGRRGYFEPSNPT